jgi:hypothetical protein
MDVLSEFRDNHFILLWRRGDDGFQARIFHSRCDDRYVLNGLIPTQ